jgi:hypothetical protein
MIVHMLQVSATRMDQGRSTTQLSWLNMHLEYACCMCNGEVIAGETFLTFLCTAGFNHHNVSLADWDWLHLIPFLSPDYEYFTQIKVRRQADSNSSKSKAQEAIWTSRRSFLRRSADYSQGDMDHNYSL